MPKPYTRDQFIKLFQNTDPSYSLPESDIIEIFSEEGIEEIVALCNTCDLEPSKAWNTEEPKAYMPLGVAMIDIDSIIHYDAPYDPSRPQAGYKSQHALEHVGVAWVFQVAVMDDAPTTIIEIQVGRGAPSLFIL